MVEDSKSLKKQPQLIILILVIIIIISALFYVVSNDEASFIGITALEGYEIAEQYSDNGTLVHIQLPGVEFKDGLAEGWTYIYLYYDTNGNLIKKSDIYVFSNNTVNFINYSSSSIIPDKIENWTIDSNDACSIAESTPSIKDFQGSCQLMTLDYIDDRPVWSLRWGKSGLLANPSSIDISIDANTGEVLYVG